MAAEDDGPAPVPPMLDLREGSECFMIRWAAGTSIVDVPDEVSGVRCAMSQWLVWTITSRTLGNGMGKQRPGERECDQCESGREDR
jgi:hypothetical protein